MFIKEIFKKNKTQIQAGESMAAKMTFYLYLKAKINYASMQSDKAQ